MVNVLVINIQLIQTIVRIKKYIERRCKTKSIIYTTTNDKVSENSTIAFVMTMCKYISLFIKKLQLFDLVK